MQKIKSFTLIELIIVIIILGILASIGIANYTATIEKQRGDACINNMRTIFAAWRIYNMKNDPDYATSSGYRTISTINNDLGTVIDERNFGNLATNEPAFSFWLQPTFIRLLAYKLRQPNQGTYLYCRYYPNGNATGIYYDWSTGSPGWPWLPDDE